MRLRIEYQGYESRQLAALLGKMTAIPGSDNRLDYVMLRLPKLTDTKDEKEESDAENNVEKDVMNFALSNALSSNLNFAKSQAPTYSNRNTSMRSSRSTIGNLRMSVKVNLRSTESKLVLKNLNLLTK